MSLNKTLEDITNCRNRKTHLGTTISVEKLNEWIKSIKDFKEYLKQHEWCLALKRFNEGVNGIIINEDGKYEFKNNTNG
jgi:hypothetical protein